MFIILAITTTNSTASIPFSCSQLVLWQPRNLRPPPTCSEALRFVLTQATHDDTGRIVWNNKSPAYKSITAVYFCRLCTNSRNNGARTPRREKHSTESSPGAQPLSTVTALDDTARRHRSTTPLDDTARRHRSTTPLDDTARRHRLTTPLATADDRDRQSQSIVTAADNSDSLCATLQRNHAIGGKQRGWAFYWRSCAVAFD